MAQACSGMEDCDFQISNDASDPCGGTAKNYVVEYKCTNLNNDLLTETISGEALGKTVSLSCSGKFF